MGFSSPVCYFCLVHMSDLLGACVRFLVHGGMHWGWGQELKGLFPVVIAMFVFRVSQPLGREIYNITQMIIVGRPLRYCPSKQYSFSLDNPHAVFKEVSLSVWVCDLQLMWIRVQKMNPSSKLKTIILVSTLQLITHLHDVVLRRDETGNPIETKLHHIATDLHTVIANYLQVSSKQTRKSSVLSVGVECFCKSVLSILDLRFFSYKKISEPSGVFS